MVVVRCFSDQPEGCNVLLLSTVLGMSKNPKRKPSIYKLYDYTKGGTDIVDQRMGTYSCHTKSRRWIVAAFAYVLDSCRVNVFTIVALNKGHDPQKQKSFDFVLDLASEFILPQIKERQLAGLQLPKIRKMEQTLGYELSNRTGLCCTEASGPGQKEPKDGMNLSRSQ